MTSGSKALCHCLSHGSKSARPASSGCNFSGVYLRVLRDDNYAGLFYNEDGVTVTNAGYFSAIVTSGGNGMAKGRMVVDQRNANLQLVPVSTLNRRFRSWTEGFYFEILGSH